MHKKILAASILSIDFYNIKNIIKILNNTSVDLVHIDIMDGIFVNNISFGFPIINIFKKYTKKSIDIHLMIENPEKYINNFKNYKVNNISIHYESCKHLHKILNKIKSFNIKTGVALNPHTPIHLLNDIIHDIDILLLMSVNPGFSGQTFIEHTFNKIKDAKNLINKKNASTLIEIDGGINLNNLNKLSESYADIFVIGNQIFSEKDPYKIINKINFMLKNI